MRIVSLNAWGGQLWPALAPWLGEIEADLFCLQEVIRMPGPAPEWHVYEDPNRRIDQRSNLVADISGELSAHQAFFAPAVRGPVTDAKGNRLISEHGIASWISRQLAVIEVHQTFIYGAYRAEGWGPEPYPRAVQLFRIADEGGRTALIMQFHGIRQQVGKGDTPERHQQAENAQAILSQHMRDGEPTILMGDFNLLPDSAFFPTMAELGLHDLVTGRGHTDTRTSLYTKPVRFADYLLVNDAVTVDAFDVPAQPEVSDHRPLILDLSL